MDRRVRQGFVVLAARERVSYSTELEFKGLALSNPAIRLSESCRRGSQTVLGIRASLFRLTPTSISARFLDIERSCGRNWRWVGGANANAAIHRPWRQRRGSVGHSVQMKWNIGEFVLNSC